MGLSKSKLVIISICCCLWGYQGISQCDFNLYGVEITPDNHFSVKAFNPNSGELMTAFDTIMMVGAIASGSHIVMNDVYYAVDQMNDLYSFDISLREFKNKRKFQTKSLRFIESAPCDSLLYGMGFQSVRGPAYLNAYDPYTDQLSQITPPSNLLNIQLDPNSIHTKLNDNYILIANGELYNIDINIGQIVNQFSINGLNLISYVADPASNLLYGIEILPTGFGLKSVDPYTGEINLVGTTIKNYTAIAKSTHAISSGFYFVMIDRLYYKLNLANGQIVDQYPIDLDIFKYAEFNNSCISLIDSIAVTATSCGQNNGLIKVSPVNSDVSYSYNWTSETDVFSTDEAEIKGLAHGEYLLTMKSIDGSCSETQKITIEESQELEYSLEHKNLGCEGDADGEINIIVDGLTSDYKYSIDNGLSFESSPDFIGLAAGLYNIVIQGNQTCTASDLVTLTEPEKLEVIFEEEIEIALGQEISLEPEILNNHPNVDLSWTSTNPQYKITCVDCDDPTIQPLSTTTYYLDIFDMNTGCVASDSMNILVRRNKREIYIPNIFSPNGDGQNDVFGIFGGDVAMISHFAVYDRWGSQIKLLENIEPVDSESLWDGTFDGTPMTNGSYSYNVKVRYLDGFEKVLRGQISLVK